MISGLLSIDYTQNPWDEFLANRLSAECSIATAPIFIRYSLGERGFRLGYIRLETKQYVYKRT